MIFASMIIVAGIAWLLQNLGYLPGDFWSIFWPLLLIAFGISILVKRRSMHSWSCCDFKVKDKK
ncbi:MAG: DUF5668 domain-containing protein [bacterium]|nr:DUF5668 domain-containing protein [bacterium]